MRPELEVREPAKDRSEFVASNPNREILLEFLQQVDYRRNPAHASFVFNMSGVPIPEKDLVKRSIKSHRKYKKTCKELRTEPYSQIRLKVPSGSEGTVHEVLSSKNNIPENSWKEKHVSSNVIGEVQRKGFHQVIYESPDNQTISYAGYLRDLLRSAYELAEGEMTITLKDSSQPYSVENRDTYLTFTLKENEGGIVDFHIGENMTEREKSDLKALFFGFKTAKSEKDVRRFMDAQDDAELRRIGAYPIDNIKPDEFPKHLLFRALTELYPDIGVSIREGTYHSHSSRPYRNYPGKSIWIDESKYNHEVHTKVEKIMRSNFYFGLEPKNHMSWVGPDILFQHFDKSLVNDGIDDENMRSRLKATISRWAIAQINRHPELSEEAVPDPERRAEENKTRQEGKEAYEKILQEIGVAPFSDEEIKDIFKNLIKKEIESVKEPV